MRQYDKVFALGFSRTGTTSLHKLFRKCNRNSWHGMKWNLDAYDAFTDGPTGIGELNDFTKLYAAYPKSLFILNTRPLEKWLISRGTHMYMKGKEGFDPSDVETYISWILKREKHFLDVLRFFQNTPNKLIVINIEKIGWGKIISKRLIGQELSDILSNKIDHNVLNPEGVKVIKTTVDRAFEILKYSDKKKSSVMVDNGLIHLYKNNLF